MKLFKDPGDKYSSFLWDLKDRILRIPSVTVKHNEFTISASCLWNCGSIYILLVSSLICYTIQKSISLSICIKMTMEKKSTINGEKKKSYWGICRLGGKEKDVANTGISNKFEVQRVFVFIHRWVKGYAYPHVQKRKRNCCQVHQLSAARWRRVSFTLQITENESGLVIA